MKSELWNTVQQLANKIENAYNDGKYAEMIEAANDLNGEFSAANYETETLVDAIYDLENSVEKRDPDYKEFGTTSNYNHVDDNGDIYYAMHGVLRWIDTADKYCMDGCCEVGNTIDQLKEIENDIKNGAEPLEAGRKAVELMKSIQKYTAWEPDVDGEYATLIEGLEELINGGEPAKKIRGEIRYIRVYIEDGGNC